MKKVTILSGVSGSGKSKYAGTLLLEYTSSTGLTLEEMLRLPKGDKRATSAYCSADTFFVGTDGTYNFDPTKLSDAHGACFREFITACQNECEMVIVDNTNTTATEIAPYILGAQAYGYDVEIITVMCESEDDVKAAAARNSHGVPFGGVMAQHKRLCERQLMPWWKNTFISAKF
jgi:hypothetical protein